MKKRTLKKLLLVATFILAIITFAIFVTAEIPWVAYITGYAAFGIFFIYMDLKENSKKARR